MLRINSPCQYQIRGSAFNPGLVVETQWGTGTFTSRSCVLISMELRPNAQYQALGYHELIYDLIHLTVPLIPCPFSESVSSSN